MTFLRKCQIWSQVQGKKKKKMLLQLSRKSVNLGRKISFCYVVEMYVRMQGLKENMISEEMVESDGKNSSLRKNRRNG